VAIASAKTLCRNVIGGDCNSIERSLSEADSEARLENLYLRQTELVSGQRENALRDRRFHASLLHEREDIRRVHVLELEPEMLAEQLNQTLVGWRSGVIAQLEPLER
jgi:hypothetical protein